MNAAEWQERARAAIALRATGEPNTGCLLWFGAATDEGYGKMYSARGGGRTVLVTRALLGIVDEPATVVRHRCDTPACVNPDHLQTGTLSDNSRDSYIRGRKVPHNAQKTHCPSGHAYGTENTYTYPGTGNRACRACKRLRRERQALAAGRSFRARGPRRRSAT